ncbi:MAG: hypothetical protein JKY96_02905, partial [Phycisphaerales bacterium]|nr:hypothetical protein [Phycisphaerales bacterium]
EPCPMCAGLIVNARLGRLVYGASDPKAGAVRSSSLSQSASSIETRSGSVNEGMASRGSRVRICSRGMVSPERSYSVSRSTEPERCT